jgi:hypothetical protein
MRAEIEAQLYRCQARVFSALGKRTATAVGSKIAIVGALVMIIAFSAGLSQQKFESDLFNLCKLSLL